MLGSHFGKAQCWQSHFLNKLRKVGDPATVRGAPHRRRGEEITVRSRERWHVGRGGTAAGLPSAGRPGPGLR
jgi:hypothetical protein